MSAEDIGKLPDSSIAEAIGRLPGIAAQRTNGRAQTLSIRGLGPDFTVTTFNGREQASTNDNRTVEFDQYPSELVTQVKVYKTPDAGMAYQGIAGTTDISTVHPLALSDRKLGFGYKREMNDQEANIPGLPDAGDRVNVTYIDQFMDNKLGVAIGVAYNKTPYQAQTREPWGYPELEGDYPGLAGDMVIGGDKDGVQSSYYKRTAYMGVLEFKPNDSCTCCSTPTTPISTKCRPSSAWSTAPCGPARRSRTRARSKTAACSRACFPTCRSWSSRTTTTTATPTVDSIGLNTEFGFNDNWSMDADLSWSKVERHDMRLESTAGTGHGTNDPTLPAAGGRRFLSPPIPTASRTSPRR